MSCEKLSYLTKHEAKQALASAQTLRDQHGHRERRLYPCRCGQYHRTSVPHRWFAPDAYAAAVA